ncbi:MAG: efflux RND transporter periplasmic adaptor subunit [Kofleriaceae bacterium]|nr:efflux RND transporter periplasmic adaptor subunit [Kofleriaceae bacterium]
MPAPLLAAVVVSALAVAAVARPVAAAPRAVTLDDVRAAAADAPARIAAHRRTLAAGADADAAGGWPATSVQVGTARSTNRLIAIAGVPLPVLGRGRAARGVARAEADVARAEETVGAVDLRLAVTLAWLALYRAEQAATLAADGAERMRALVDVAAARRDAGDASEADVVNATAQAARARLGRRRRHPRRRDRGRRPRRAAGLGRRRGPGHRRRAARRRRRRRRRRRGPRAAGPAPSSRRRRRRGRSGPGRGPPRAAPRGRGRRVRGHGRPDRRAGVARRRSAAVRARRAAGRGGAGPGRRRGGDRDRAGAPGQRRGHGGAPALGRGDPAGPRPHRRAGAGAGARRGADPRGLPRGRGRSGDGDPDRARSARGPRRAGRRRGRRRRGLGRPRAGRRRGAVSRAARAALALAALVAACNRGGGETEDETPRPAVRVACLPVATTSLAEPLVLRGVVAPPPRAEAVIAATVSGRITKIAVEEGDVVAAGALIAVIEDPSLGATAAESGAELAAAQAELRVATADRARRESLVAKGISPQKELDAAIAREEAARAAVDAATARRQLARGRLARTELRSPRAGTVLHVHRRAGEVVDGADTAIAEVADLSVLELRTQVTGAELIGLVAGGAADVVLDARPGVVIPGEVVVVAPALDPGTALGTVRIRLQLPDGVHPAVGLPGQATVRRAPHPAILIPSAAVRRSIAGHDEVLVCAGGVEDHVEVRDVTVGSRGDGTLEIAAGLTAGERIVVDHVLGLEDGQAIEVAAP